MKLATRARRAMPAQSNRWARQLAILACIASQWIGVAGAQSGDTTPPTTPGTPIVTSPSSTQLVVAWPRSMDNVGVVGYRVYRNGSTTPLLTQSATNFADNGLSPSTTYSYVVRAIDAAGNASAASPAGSGTTRADLPPPTRRLPRRRARR